MADVLFKNATVLTVTDEEPVIENGYVSVTGESIEAVGAGEADISLSARRTVDCRGMLLMPGLINAHAHTPMCVMRGYADDMPLKSWLFDKVFPAEARLGEQAVRAGARLGFAEMIKSGTVSASDMYFFEPAIAQTAVEVGMRVSLTNGIVAFGEGFDPHDRSISEIKALVRDYHGAGRGLVRADAGIHGEYTSNPDAWRFMTELALQYGLVLQIHLSESKEEHEGCIERRGMTPARALLENGVFRARVAAAHCACVTDEDMDILAAAGAAAVHNPVSNLKLGNPTARIVEMKKRGVHVALGTDGCCSNNSHDLFEEMKLAALLQKGMAGDPSVMSAREALELATAGGAYAQGRENETGRIKRGMKADLILIDGRSPSVFPVHDPFSAAVYAARGSDVRLTMINGRILYENGEFTTIDIEKTVREAERLALPAVKGEKA